MLPSGKLNQADSLETRLNKALQKSAPEQLELANRLSALEDTCSAEFPKLRGEAIKAKLHRDTSDLRFVSYRVLIDQLSEEIQNVQENQRKLLEIIKQLSSSKNAGLIKKSET